MEPHCTGHPGRFQHLTIPYILYRRKFAIPTSYLAHVKCHRIFHSKIPFFVLNKMKPPFGFIEMFNNVFYNFVMCVLHVQKSKWYWTRTHTDTDKHTHTHTHTRKQKEEVQLINNKDDSQQKNNRKNKGKQKKMENTQRAVTIKQRIKNREFWIINSGRAATKQNTNN